MRIATWNLNNRVGRVPFRPEAAKAAMALNADIVVLNEFYPGSREAEFISSFEKQGCHHLETASHPAERTNRVLIASKMPLQRISIDVPTFDNQFASNVLAVADPVSGLSIVGVRVPWYNGKDAGLVHRAWDWLEAAIAELSKSTTVVLGDFNVDLRSPRSRGGEHFRRILDAGWHRAAPPSGGSYFTADGRSSEIDHILGSPLCRFNTAEYVTEAGGYSLAASEGSISDHCALVAELVI
jgi:endonuclease/exonuclease/phosphatase family metal-dependent hydrolase